MKDIISPNYQLQLDGLAETLVTPERYAEVGATVLRLFPLPEVARVYEFPRQEQ